MGKFIIKRLLGLIPTLFVIVTLSFFITRLAPGGPFASEKKVPPEILANLEKQYHMDEPLFKQYLRYVGNVLHGDLGPSFKNKDFTVNQLIGSSMPNSLLLGVISLAFAMLFGITFGLISAVKQNTWIDYSTMSFASVGLSVPLFVVGPVAVFVFALWGAFMIVSCCI